MLSVKQELLGALAAELEKLSPGAGAKAAFESPKVAAHGDFACTAAMQLAKPLKQNPRRWPRRWWRRCNATPAFAAWVDALEIAGPGFINVRLKPAAKQQVVREVLAAGERFGTQPANGQRVLVEFVSANPTGPLHVGHGRQAALGDAICNLFATQGWERAPRVLLQRRRGADQHAGQQSRSCARKGLKPGDAELAGSGLQRRLHRRHCGRLSGEKDRQVRRPRVHRQRRRGRPGRHPPVRRGLPAPRAGPRPEGLRVKFDHYYLESSLYTSGKVDAAVHKLQDAGKTYEQDGALWLKSTDYGDDKDRVMRKGDGSLHLLRARRGLPHHQVGARLHEGASTSRAPTTTAPSRGCAPACRRRAWAFPQATPTTCCTPWCA